MGWEREGMHPSVLAGRQASKAYKWTIYRGMGSFKVN